MFRVIIGVCLSVSIGFAQIPPDGRDAVNSDTPLKPPTTPPSVVAVKVEVPPTLDGEVVADPVWGVAPAASGFWQVRPEEGKAGTERTEVRIVYTKEVLYIGVVCYDRTPGGIIVTDSRRDSSLSDTDSFQIVLDTYRDFQNGFVFGTNPAGIEYDGQVSNEGRGTGFGGGRQQGGSGGGFNINWDGSWEVRAKISSIGWSAEFAIPFRTLRYPSKDVQTWGINFQRNIRRHQEVSFWSPLARQFNIYRLSDAGTITGLEIPSQRNLKLMPYVLGKIRRQGRPDAPVNWLGESGGDVKYSLTPSMTLDVTYNTDFAQVEVDEQQINLDRFNLFFPEKRPFFLENAGLFSVGDPGEVDLFFSRRIGVGPRGRSIPILAGARVTGKVARTNIGLLNMQTDEVEGLTPGNNFSVGRISRELPNRSSIGAIFTNRQETGEMASVRDSNRAFAFDGSWGVGQYGSISGFVAKTSTPGVSDDQYAFKFGASRDEARWRLSADYTEVADNFNPEMGFLQRDGGYRKAEFSVMHRYRPERFLGLHEVRPHATWRGFWNFDGFQETGYVHLDSHWEFKNGYEIHTGMNLTKEGVTEAFEIFPGVRVPVGTYDHREAQIVANTNQASWLSFRFRLTRGGFFGGDRTATSPSMTLRKGETLSTNISWDRNGIDLPGGGFVTNLVRARVSYSFTPRLFVQSLVQYNDRDDVWSMNFRIGWLQAANTGLFIVYNETRDVRDISLGIPDRSLIIKFSRLFDIFE